jgi:hypothetical protein
MPRGVTFDELLQQQLLPPSIDSRPVGTHGPAGVGAAYGFFFVEGSRSSGSLAGAGIGLSSAGTMSGRDERNSLSSSLPAQGRTYVHRPTSGRSHQPLEARGMVPRPVLTLSPREQQAFDALAVLGAGLSPAFSFEELRSAFRQLARRYHPDRHTACGDAETSRLAGTFTQARDAYRVLAERFRRLH